MPGDLPQQTRRTEARVSRVWSDFIQAKHPYHGQMCVLRHPFEAHALDPRYCRHCPHRRRDDCHASPPIPPSLAMADHEETA